MRISNPPLLDKLALVTGAAGTMGRAVVQTLLTDGCRVAMIDRATAPLRALEAEQGERVAGFVCDIGDPEAVAATHRQVRERFGEIDGEILDLNGGLLMD